jgi:glycosyltransferase involved in cell wall biosynthesis
MIVHGFAGNDLHPPVSGASQRLMGLYRGLARRHVTQVLALVPNRHRGPDDQRVNGVRIRRHREWYTSPAWRLEQAGLLPMFAIALPGHRARVDAMTQRLDGTPDVRIADLALAGVLAKDDGALRVLHCHNVEYDHFRSAGPGVVARGWWAERLREFEALACAEADLVVTVSDQDAERMHELYRIPRERLLAIPNGYDELQLMPPTAEERRAARAALNLDDCACVALFIGSDVPHNRAGLRAILDAMPASGADPIVLLVVGGVAHALTSADRTRFAGDGRPRLIAVPETTDVKPYFHAADLGLNPVVGGGGSNVKLPSYLAAGLPVLTTPHGLRGYSDLEGAVMVADPSGFGAALARFCAMPAPPGRPAPAALASYAWGTLGERLGAALEERVRVRRPARAEPQAGAAPRVAEGRS